MFLSASYNSLTGSIPSTFGSLSQLQELRFENNLLNSSIPSELGRMNTLTILSLMRNKLSGPIPPSFGLLSSLEELYLNSNRLSSGVPLELCSMVALTAFTLHNVGDTEDRFSCVQRCLLSISGMEPMSLYPICCK